MSATEGVRIVLTEVLASFGIKFLLDLPCGDVHWIQSLDFVEISRSSSFFFSSPSSTSLSSLSTPPMLTYMGADISPFLIERNNKRLEMTRSAKNISIDGSVEEDGDVLLLRAMVQSLDGRVSFSTLDLVNGSLPNPEQEQSPSLLFCRHMMIHLLPVDNLAALKNVQASGFSYMMATTHVRADENLLLLEGRTPRLLGHKINLFRSPYCLRDPIRLYRDSYGRAEGDEGDEDLFMGLWELGPRSGPLMRDGGC